MENIFQRPPILMRLTMLTRDKMSLLRAASLRTAWETAHGLNDRKQRGWVEAGILPTELLPLSGRSKYIKDRALCARSKWGQPENPRFYHSHLWVFVFNAQSCVKDVLILGMDSKGR